MNGWLRKYAIEGLRWALGLVVLWESCLLLRGTMAKIQGGPGAAHAGAHLWVRLILASVEIVASLMFLAPVVNVAGSYLLLAVFAFAMVFHALRGQFDVGGLIVYGMAVVACLVYGKDARRTARDER